MRTRKHLRGYQVRGQLRIIKQKRLGLFVDMSLGKTVIVLTAIRNLIDQGKIKTAWVIAPIDVTKDTWQEEAKLWTHLQDLSFTLVEGKPNSRLQLLKSSAQIKVISYTLLPWISKLLDPRKVRRSGPPTWLPQFLTLDESEFIKGRGAWFKALKRRIIKHIPYRVIQTGTPAAHSLFDLWAQIYVIDKGARLSTAFDRYRGRYFVQSDWQGYKFEPREGAEERIYQQIDDIILRLDAEDWIKLPKIIPHTEYVDLPPRAMRLYREYEEEMFMQLDNLKEIEAANAAVLSGHCWQLAGGAIYDDPEERDSWSEIHTAKLDKLNQLIIGAVGNPVIVAYWFRHERDRLEREYPRATFVRKDNIVEVRRKWNQGKIPLLFINPGRSSHGLNMQFGGHRIFFFSQLWSGGKHDQLIARLRRPDQASPHILATYITARNTVDEIIAASRTHRLRGQAALLNALRKYAKEKRRVTH